jgi:5-methylcytosine-specific restriction endonuclease McrA
MVTSWAIEMAESARRRMVELGKKGRVELIEPDSIFARDRWLCQICFRPIPKTVSSPYDPQRATIDHRLPLAAGGNHTYSNLQSAHLGCNSAKGAKAQPPS